MGKCEIKKESRKSHPWISRFQYSNNEIWSIVKKWEKSRGNFEQVKTLIDPSAIFKFTEEKAPRPPDPKSWIFPISLIEPLQSSYTHNGIIMEGDTA